MKKTLLILLLSISSVAFGQNYQGYVPFPTDGAYWVDKYRIVHTFSQDYCINYEYRLKGDTVINGLLYYEIETTEIDMSTPNGCGPPWNWVVTTYPFGYLRNDSANKKVWVRYPNATADSLFYDFDINVGDTIHKTINDTVVVDSVDTVYLGNRYRKKFYITTNNYCTPGYGFDYMIEGVGRSTGFAGRDYCALAGGGYDLVCTGDSSGGIFPDSIGCNLTTNLNEKEQKIENFEFYPNPTSGKVNLTFEKPLQSIEVYNLQGQKVQEINPKNRSWELPQQSGLYLIRIQDEEGRIHTEKVIKN